jgi:hypothetical protein
MQKVSPRQRFMLTLPGLILFAAFLIISGVQGLITGTPKAFAAGAMRSQDASPDCTEGKRQPGFGTTVVVSRGNVVCGDLTSFGGKVIIDGEVVGDVVVFGSNVILNGGVDGNVTLYGGNLISAKGTHVNGDIHVCGGHWTEDTDSQLHGSFFSCTEGLNSLLKNDAGIQFRFWYVVTWVILGMLLTTLLPEHVMMVRTTVKSKMRRSLALGILSILLAPIVLTVLLALIISIPLAILVAVGLIAAWALGTVAVGWIIGDIVVQKIAPHHDTRLMQVAVGLAILALAGSLPYIGWGVSILTGMIGLGAVFLSRFGTRLYSQPRRPFP